MANEEFVGALTLLEYSQRMTEGAMERAILETFVRESDVMMALPMLPVNKGKYAYPQEEELPTVAHRAFNEDGNISSGKMSMQEEGVFIMDEYIRVDRAILDRYGEKHRNEQIALKVKNMARNFTNDFLSGSNTTDPREPDGLQVRSASSEQTVVQNSAVDGGGALSLGKLDEATNEVRNPTHIIADRSWIPRLKQAARSPTLTNNMFNMDMTDPLGRKVLAFGELPFLFGYPKSRSASILPSTETSTGGSTATATSMYVVSFGEEGCFCIEGTALKHTDEGQLQGAPVYSDHIKWDFGFVSKEYSICRLRGCLNSTAIVA